MSWPHSLAERRFRNGGSSLLKATRLTNPSPSRLPESAPNLAPTQAKYADPNPLVQYANRRFMRTVFEMAEMVHVESILDAGCGEGTILNSLQSPISYGMDVDFERVLEAKSDVEGGRLAAGDVHRLPFPSESVDLVLMMEVFEHLGDPHAALAEVARVSRRYLLASVPNEPWWRIGNMLRLKYLKEFGNTPEHLNHWTSRGFRRFISGSFNVLEVRRPFLWTFVLAEKAA